MDKTLTRDVPVSRPKITLLMVLCGIVGTAAAGAVSAATFDDVPKLVIRYRADSLSTDRGVWVLYRRLRLAAEDVCPAPFTGSHLVSESIQQCRDHALAQAVNQIDNPRLAALYAATSKKS